MILASILVGLVVFFFSLLLFNVLSDTKIREDRDKWRALAIEAHNAHVDFDLASEPSDIVQKRKRLQLIMARIHEAIRVDAP